MGMTNEDCISRQAAIDEIINLWADKPFGNPALVEIKDCIEKLPPVTPKPKIGHWIDEPYYKISEYMEEDTYYTRKCSECFEKYDEVFNYCPNCGARMQEVEE